MFYKTAQKFKRNRRRQFRRGFLQRGGVPRRFIKGVSRTGGYYNRFQTKKSYEKKYIDKGEYRVIVAADAWEIPTATNALAFVPRGTGPSDRIGRKIYIHEIYYRFDIQNILVSEDNKISVAIVQDRQCNGAAPSALDVMDTNNFQSFLNMENSNRFKILYRKNVLLAARSANNNGSYRSVEGRLRFKQPILINFDEADPGTGVGNLQSNNIFLMLYNGSTTTNASVRSNIRLRYTD